MNTSVPEQYRDFAEGLIDAARSTLENQGKLAPIVVIGDTERNYLCPVGGLGNLPPSIAIQVVRDLAEKEHANFVMVGLECWAAIATSEAEAIESIANREKVSERPDRISAVYLSLETYDGTWSAIVAREGDEGHYTFGKVELRFAEINMSPFSDLLPRRTTDTLQ